MIAGAGAAPAYCLAQGEHGRRAGAELRVLAGDLRRLSAADQTEPHQQGLRERLRGALAALDLLLRLADQEAGRPAKQYRDKVRGMFDQLNQNELGPLAATLQALVQQFGLKPIHGESGHNDHQAARALHSKLCAHCHDNPVSDVKRPAYNLFAEARALTSDEFFARMLVGVRGDRVTGIDNPLSDLQILDLIRFYTSAAQ